MKIGDKVKFKTDHGVLMIGEVIELTESAARIWTPISVFIASNEQIIEKFEDVERPTTKQRR